MDSTIPQALTFLKQANNCHIIHDFDADGIASGLLVYHSLNQLGATASTSTVRARGGQFTIEHLEYVKSEYNPNQIIITDLNPNLYKQLAELHAVFPDTPILILDHHTPLVDDSYLLVHPEMYGMQGHRMCASMLCHKVLSELVDLSEYRWLTVIGILGDMNQKYFMDFIQQTAADENVPLSDDLYTSEFGRINEIIDCASAHSDQALQSLIAQLKACKSFTQAKQLANPHPEVLAEVKRLIDNKYPESGPVSFIDVSSPYQITSWVSNTISAQNKARVYVFFSNQGDEYKLSFRMQHAARAGIHVGKLADPLLQPYRGKAGGHAPASGGVIKKEFFKAFQKQYVDAIDEALNSN